MRAGNTAKRRFCDRDQEGHRMPWSAREVVLPSADAAAVLGLGFLIKAAKLSTTNSR
jgi:hypothetical protein